MAACEICWTEASRKALMLGGMTAEYYHAELDAHPEHAQEGNAALADVSRTREDLLQ